MTDQFILLRRLFGCTHVHYFDSPCLQSINQQYRTHFQTEGATCSKNEGPRFVSVRFSPHDKCFSISTDVPATATRTRPNTRYLTTNVDSISLPRSYIHTTRACHPNPCSSTLNPYFTMESQYHHRSQAFYYEMPVLHQMPLFTIELIMPTI